MGRAIKLILYYLAYQLLFIFLATGTDATIALIGGADITANFRPGTIKRVCMKFQKKSFSCASLSCYPHSS